MRIDGPSQVTTTPPVAEPAHVATPLTATVAPLPATAAAKVPTDVAERLDGAPETKLRTVLAALQRGVTEKTVQLAVNQLRTHPRSEVRAALMALLAGDVEAVEKHLPQDPLDFARSALKEIATKMSARTEDATERTFDLAAGVIAGVAPLPTPAAPFAHDFEYTLGQRFGAAAGLAESVAIFLGGVGLGGGGVALTVVTDGLLAPLGVPAAGVGASLAAGGMAGAAFYGARLLRPHAVFTHEARASEPRREPTAIEERHIARGEVGSAKSGARRATGYHLESSTENARVVEHTRTAPDSHGVYEAEVEIRDPKSGRWVRKAQSSTFFPANYTLIDMRRAILEAFENATDMRNGRFVGTSQRGVRILLIVDDDKHVVTACPIRERRPQ